MDDIDLELSDPGRDHPDWSRPARETIHDAAPDAASETIHDAAPDAIDPDPTPVDGVAAVPFVDDPLVRPTELAATPAVPPVDPAGYPGLAAADGRRRRRTALAVIVAAAAAGAAGMYVGTRIESPADRAAARQAPIPSLITVPVERRQLTAEIVLNGEVAYNEPVTVKLAGGVGIGPGDTAVVTEVREAGTQLNEGDLVVEVTGRPVLALQGDLPMYRRLAVGSEGPDVLQLEQALARLGYAVEPVDTVFDATTATAVEQFYTDRGYTAEGPSSEQEADLAAAREAVTGAERGVADARAALAEADDPLPESQRLQLQQAVNDAREAVPAAETAAQTTRTEQDQLVTNANAARNTARTERDAAVTVRDRARAGAINPDTGETYTPEEIAALDVAAAQAEQAFTAAEGQVVIAEQVRATTIAAADAAIDDAQAQLRIAEAQYREATAGNDTRALADAVTAAEAVLATAAADLLRLQAAAGTRISPGELVFVPVLPSTLTESYVTLGSGIEGPIGLLATTDTLVRARVARADAALVAVGADVGVEIRDAGITTTGTVLSIGEPQTSATGGDQPGVGAPGNGGGASGRMEVVVAPAADVDLNMYMWYGARVRVQIDTTDGDVLVVPVAALTVGPDEVSQVEVERTPATDDRRAETEVVAVTVGLTADGLAEVAPVDAAALVEGDRVVIGVDTNTLPGTGGDGGDAGDGGSEAPDGEQPDSSGSNDDDDENEATSTSPLAELMGWVSDPVEQRRQNLAIEEAIVACMAAEGWEYTAIDWESQMPEGVENQGTREFGEKYGYGVMYNYETYELDPDDGGGMVFDDPNMEYVNSLTPDEQEAYNAALSGDPSIWPTEPEYDADGNELWVSPPLDQQGCQGKARLEVVGEDPTSDPGVQQALNDYYSSQANDAELDQMVRQWVECFQPKLAEYAIDTVPQNIEDGYQLMDTEKYKAMGAEVVTTANQAEMDEYFSSGENVISAWSDQTGAGYVVLAPGEPGDPLPELSGEQIDQLTAMEIDLWKADQACRAELGYDDYLRNREQALVDQLLGEFPDLGG